MLKFPTIDINQESESFTEAFKIITCNCASNHT